MNKGCLIFAHDGDLDYGTQAVISARFAKKNLNVPVSLISDKCTINNINDNFKELPFDQIIEIPLPESNNTRLLGTDRFKFINDTRFSAYKLTPYDRTLLIDSDFLILSNTLEKYWDSTFEFLITPGMLELQNSISPKDHQLSPNTINLLWATNIMFSKTDNVKILFDLVDYIKEEYEYFSHLYEFECRQYRNDYAFSVACHIMSSHGLYPWHGELPVPLFYRDTDEILDIQSDGNVSFLLKNINGIGHLVSHCRSQDVHIMNKLSILKNKDKFMELSNG